MASSRVDIVAKSGDAGQYEIEGDDEDGETWQDPATLIQHYGFRSKPGPRVEAITTPGRGAASQRVIIATRSVADLPAELADWEADIYARFGQRIHLQQNGRLTLLAANGTRVDLHEDGRIILTSKGGATVTLSATDTTTEISHIAGTGGTPTALPDPAGIGPGGTVAGVTGTDNAFDVSLIADPGVAPPGKGNVCQILFARTFSKGPWATVSAQGGTGADLGAYISSISPVGMTLAVSKGPLDKGQTYNLSVVVVG